MRETERHFLVIAAEILGFCKIADENSEDWLPLGWSVEVKVRNCGKKDEVYLNIHFFFIILVEV